MNISSNAAADILDINKARLLIKSATHSNPKHPPNWIAAARLEEVAGNIQAARQLIHKGCEECPNNENVWLEASRLATPDEQVKAVVIANKGLNLIPNYDDDDDDDVSKIKVLMRGLEHIPDSVRLWMAVLKLSNNEEQARLLLHRTVEFCPFHVEFWLALVRLETSYEAAKTVLNRAREKVTEEPAGLWIIAAAKLEEAHGNTTAVGEIIEKGIGDLQRQGLVIDRDAWMKVAEAAERTGFIATCQAIVGKAIGFGVEDQDRKRIWMADAEECEKSGSIETARAIYAHALTVFLSSSSIPNSEEIWLAAFKLEFENHEPERARMLLSKAREWGCGTERVWMKSAMVERELGNIDEERRLLNEGLKLFPSFFKLWLMLGQLEEDRLGRLEKAKEAYKMGLKHCPNSIPLWLSLANLEEKVNGMSKARAVLTVARETNPQNPELWLAAVGAELKHGNKKESDILMEKALQECPNNGILWAASIELEPHTQRKRKIVYALKKCGDDPHVMAAVAKLFWQEGKVDKARIWLNQVVKLAPDIGDLWALYYKFELQHGSEEMQKDVMRRCVAAEPKYGEKWQAISKAVENSHQPIEAILKKVVLILG